jgi:hypothetical protein
MSMKRKGGLQARQNPETGGVGPDRAKLVRRLWTGYTDVSSAGAPLANAQFPLGASEHDAITDDPPGGAVEPDR